MIPETYEQWHHSITVQCKLELTGRFIDERLAALQDDGDPGTARFATLYGRDYLRQVIGWFEEARRRVGVEGGRAAG